MPVPSATAFIPIAVLFCELALAFSPIAVPLKPPSAPTPYCVFADATPPHITIATITAATLLPASEVTTDLTLDLPSRFAISDTTTQAFLVFDHITLYI